MLPGPSSTHSALHASFSETRPPVPEGQPPERLARYVRTRVLFATARLSLTKIPCNLPQMPVPEAIRKAQAVRGPA